MFHRSSAIGLASGIAAGATLMCLFDPTQGKRRRALLLDKSRRFARQVGDASGKVARDASNRLTGLAARRSAAADETTPPDRVLMERVRAVLGRHVSHPHAVDVVAKDGAVCLSGPILADEAIDLLDATRNIAGVDYVEDCLDRHAAADIPALQGGETPARRWSYRSWSPTTRALAGVGALAGVTVAVMAWSALRSMDVDAGDGWDPAGFA
jgi:hypothetical protein